MMTRSRDQKLWCVSCDSCAAGAEEIETSDVPDWSDLIAHLKQDGWRSVRFGDSWLHECPDCSKKGKTP